MTRQPDEYAVRAEHDAATLAVKSSRSAGRDARYEEGVVNALAWAIGLEAMAPLAMRHVYEKEER